MIRGVLFDMDGVLVNNTQAHVKAFEIFCERYGVEDWQHKLQTAFGMGNDDIMRLILPEEIIREKGMKALGEEKEAIYREVYAPEIRPVRGLVELLEELRRRGIRCAVGSSGCRENVDFVLSNCGITDYFSCIVSGDRVTRCKPDPEIYLLAAEGLHLPSAECLVFEDARVGITAARRAGAGRIVALATTLPRHTLATQTEADVVIDDFASITDLHIAFHADIRSNTTAFLSDSDVTSLFCNLLDNAVEASQRIKDSYIEISATQREHTPFIIITMINSCACNPFSPNGELISSKPDPQAHGFGIKSIEKIVHNYNGNMQMYYDGETFTFHTIIMLKMKP